MWKKEQMFENIACFLETFGIGWGGGFFCSNTDVIIHPHWFVERGQNRNRLIITVNRSLDPKKLIFLFSFMQNF